MKNALLAVGGFLAAVIIILQVLILCRIEQVQKTAESAEVSAMDAVELAKEARAGK